jgi:hypothetical protein
VEKMNPIPCFVEINAKPSLWKKETQNVGKLVEFKKSP